MLEMYRVYMYNLLGWRIVRPKLPVFSPYSRTAASYSPSRRMERKEKLTNIFVWAMLPFGLAAAAWSLVYFPFEEVGIGMAALAFTTIFLSSYFSIQLPRTKIHLTISDGMIFLSMLIFGGPFAVVLATLEAAYSSWSIRRQGSPMKLKSVLINTLIAAFATFFTSVTITLIFGPMENMVKDTGNLMFFWLLAVAAISQFLINSFCISLVIAIKTDTTFRNVWNEYCLNALVMFVGGAAMAGLAVIALQQINIKLFAAVIAVFTLVYFTYRRYVDDIRITAAKAEESERKRAEQAETHVAELEHYVAEMEKTSVALRESREMLFHAAYHDELTGLPNGNQVIDAIREQIEKRKVDPQHNFAVLFLDLNRFKTINDSLGHETGDVLIKHVAKRLQKLLTPGDIAGRFSGDEFAILMTQFAVTKEVTDLAASVAKRLAEPFRLGNRRVFTSVGVGIAFVNGIYAEPREILRDADIAMYYAKENQKDFVIFDKKMHMRAVTLLQLETDLRFAVEREELEIFYQPIVGLGNTKLAGFEALVRWNHPTRGQVLPSEFIPVAEDTGMIVPMTLQILKTACLQFVDWQRRFETDDNLTISVNLSGKHFAHPELVRQIQSILDETNLRPQCLKLEITESAMMANAENAIAMLKQIREIGVQLSIDDFGTGHSSLSYLQRFPVNTLKIDRSFVNAMEDGSENGEIVRTVLALAKILKLDVVAEGIESITQFHQLRVLGCEYGQGYLFSRPLPVREIEKMLANKFQWEDILPAHEFAPLIQDDKFKELTAVH